MTCLYMIGSLRNARIPYIAEDLRKATTLEMSPWLVGLVSICYAGTAIEQIIKENYWFGIMWLCYAVANLALMKAGAI